MRRKSPLEERLERIECLIEKISQKIDRLERVLTSSDDEVVVGEILAAFTLPPVRLAKAITGALRFIRGRELDEISRCIVEALSVKQPQSISELTRNVRKIRGRASRTTISKKVAELERKGIVRISRRGHKLEVELSAEKAEVNSSDN